MRDSRLLLRYEACWAEEQEAKDIIVKTWRDKSGNVIDGIEEVRTRLGRWQSSK